MDFWIFEHNLKGQVIDFRIWTVISEMQLLECSSIILFKVINSPFSINLMLSLHLLVIIFCPRLDLITFTLSLDVMCWVIMPLQKLVDETADIFQ